MANEEQLARLQDSSAEQNGCVSWNQWRQENPDESIDLTDVRFLPASSLPENFIGAQLQGADLRHADLTSAVLSHAVLTNADLRHADLTSAILGYADLSHADLRHAQLRDAEIYGADLRGATLRNAHLARADLVDADLRGADLSFANLSRVDLTNANLRGANLTSADLTRSDLTNVDLTDATLNRARIYGISTWDVKCSPTTQQQDLIISRPNQPEITIDMLEVAQFLYLLLNNERIRDVIDTLTMRAVLILGHFDGRRLAILQALREALRQRNYLPILFDFPQSDVRNYTETALTLARLSRFIIADLTDARRIPQELQAIVPACPSVPVQPILLASQLPWAMFQDVLRYPWVLPPFAYTNADELLRAMEARVIAPAEAKVIAAQKQV